MTISEQQTVRALCVAARDCADKLDYIERPNYRAAATEQVILATRKALSAAWPLLEEDKLSAELLFKADLFDYVCWLESQDPLGMQGYHKCGDALVLASDGTTIWAKTYADAFKVAMQHDKEIFDAQHTKSP